MRMIPGLLLLLLGLPALVLAAAIGVGTAAAPAANPALAAPAFTLDYRDLPPLSGFTARDGIALTYRLYPAAGDKVAVLIHGSAGESTIMHGLAKAVRDAGYSAYVPTLRGHGHDARPGDVDHIGQLDEDLADLLAHLRGRQAVGRLVLAGHSSGGGFALRIAEGPLASEFARIVLLSPMLWVRDNPALKPLGGWAAPHVPRIIALTVLEKLGLGVGQGLEAIRFGIIPDAKVPLVGAYTYRMLRSFSAPEDGLARLAAVPRPLALLVGEADELFQADRFAPMLLPVKPDLAIRTLPGVSHLGIVTQPQALPAVVATITAE